MMQSLHLWSTSWFNLPEIKGEFIIPNVGGVSLRWELKSQPEKGLNIRHEKLAKALPNWSRLTGHSIPPPILFVDEANRLKCLLEDEKGSSVLSDFFA